MSSRSADEAYRSTRSDGTPTGELELASTSPLRQFLTGAAFGMRPGEVSLAWLFFIYFVLLATCVVFVICPMG